MWHQSLSPEITYMANGGLIKRSEKEIEGFLLPLHGSWIRSSKRGLSHRCIFIYTDDVILIASIHTTTSKQAEKKHLVPLFLGPHFSIKHLSPGIRVRALHAPMSLSGPDQTNLGPLPTLLLPLGPEAQFQLSPGQLVPA